MNRKKRKVSGGWATSSNQKHSTVPLNDTVEGREMAAMDHAGTSVVDLDDDGEELAEDGEEQEKLTDFVEGGKGGSPGLELRSTLDLVASRKIVSVDSKKMSPVLWRSLPKDLLALVLARLPLPDITRLRSLSNDWMGAVNSAINRALDETSPTMVTAFSLTDYSINSVYTVTICDLRNRKSPYSYHLHPGESSIGEWDDMGACDGGLVCFVSTRKPTPANPLCIVVMNLLTQARRKLPRLHNVYSRPPQMMQIEVDSASKCYRVVVIGNDRSGRATVETYHSGAGQWTQAQPPHGFIFGFAHSRWKYSGNQVFRSTNSTRSVHDFADGNIKRFDERDPSRGASVMASGFWKDCMFVLHRRNTPNGESLQVEGHCITKYRIHNNLKDWVQERSYLCSPLEDYFELQRSLMSLNPCEGFLIVSRHSSDHFWVLDLSTGEWSSLPNCFKGHSYGTFLSRAFWNVVP